MTINTTGWNDLLAGHIIQASYNYWEILLNGWFIAIIFILYESLILIKTRNMTIGWATGLFFMAVYATTAIYKPISVNVMFLILVFELAAILFSWLWRS